MNNFTRKTQEYTFDGLRPDLAAAIRAHAELYGLGDFASTALICCQTVSTEQKKGLFGGSTETITMGILLTPAWLIWATAKGNEKPVVASGRLRDIQVQAFEDTAMFKIIPDSGLNITGRYSDVTKQGMVFIGLGPEPAALKFRQFLQDAMQKANV
jgi:hypothetical protein